MAAAAGRPSRWSGLSRWLPLLGWALGMVALTGLSVAYMAVHVPLRVPALSAANSRHAWPVAALSLLLLAVVDALFVAFLMRRPLEGHARSHPQGRPLDVAWDLSVGRVPLRAVAATTGAAAVLLAEALWLGLPLWALVLVVLIPWIALYLGDARWRFARFGAYAVFATLVVLQLGHLAEHIAQNVQLLLTHSARASRGIFGQLDIESVHVAWNLLVWVGIAYLLWKVGRRNPWLWLAFAAASVHTVEHVYLFWVYVAERPLYLQGGSNGILAQGGLLPTALARPYLHLLYNVVEVMPLVVAFWWQLTEPEPSHGVKPAEVLPETSPNAGLPGQDDPARPRRRLEPTA